ncbi:MAG TPA: hypothetical protein VLA25_00840, partial [Methylotenera sp.]|nr:hypothetical protein [Methylotenera sp.]
DNMPPFSPKLYVDAISAAVDRNAYVRDHKWVHEHAQALRAIAAGKDVWSSTHDHVVKFRDYCKDYIIPLLSTTHLIEYAIRETGLAAQITERSEGLRSAILVIRSTVADEASKHIKAEQAAGRVEATKRTPRGAVYSKALHKISAQILERSRQERNQIGTDAAKDLLGLLRNAFTADGNASKLLTSNNLRRKAENVVEKPLNKRQRERGVTRSNAVVGLVEFGNLKPIAKYRDALVAELHARGVVREFGTTQNALRDEFRVVLELRDDQPVVSQPVTDGFASLFLSESNKQQGGSKRQRRIRQHLLVFQYVYVVSL